MSEELIVFKEYLRNTSKYLLITLTIFFNYSPLNITVASEPPHNRVHLKVSPRLCTLTKSEYFCEVLVNIDWKSDTEQSLCLKFSNKPEMNKCWDKCLKGHIEIQMSLAEDLTVELRDKNTQSILASKTLGIAREKNNFRRKRRQPWSMF